MPFIERDGDGNITGLYARPQWEGQEILPPEAAELVALQLEGARAERLEEIKRAGFVRVYRDYPPHAQTRLAFKAESNGERKACAELIEKVKAEVDMAEAAIATATTEAEIEAARAGAVTALEAI